MQIHYRGFSPDYQCPLKYWFPTEFRISSRRCLLPLKWNLIPISRYFARWTTLHFQSSPSLKFVLSANPCPQHYQGSIWKDQCHTASWQSLGIPIHTHSICRVAQKKWLDLCIRSTSSEPSPEFSIVTWSTSACSTPPYLLASAPHSDKHRGNKKPSK